jgi:predicted DsbA family dithiol-disulfide isomerase
MTAPPVILFADFVCPFSYVTEAALRRLVAGSGRRIEHRAYELYPAPAPLPERAADEQSLAALQPLAAEVDVRVGPRGGVPRTRKAHEAARFAREQGREAALRQAIYHAFWEEGRDIGRIDVLVSLAEAVGIEGQALKIALDIDVHADAVLADRLAADRSGIRHTPTLIIDAQAEPLVAVGAQRLADLEALLAEAGP